MSPDTDRMLNYYIKRIDSVKLEFPKLTSPEMDSAVQNAVDEWTDDAEDVISEHLGDGHSDDTSEGRSVKGMLRRIGEMDPSFDASPYEEADDEDPKAIGQLSDILAQLEESATENVKDHLLRTSEEVRETLRAWFKAMSALDPATRRCLWGLTPSDFKRGMVQDLGKYSKVFRYDKEVRRFTDILGRLTQLKDANGDVVSFCGDSRISGTGSEIKGVELGRDINNIVPSELSSMMDDDLSILFDLKYAEGRLMSFSREDSVEMEDDDKGDYISPNNLGPVVLICDTSGSMSGTPLFLAKALCWTIITRASEQGRRVLRIDFNARSRHVDITPDNHIHELHQFITTRASGGTDPGPAIREAVELVHEDRYRLADIVVISDFGLDMSNFRRENRNMTALRENGCRIHSVFIPSRYAKGKECFDSNWGISGLRKRSRCSFTQLS